MIQLEPAVRIRPTAPADLDFVLALEQHPDNSRFIAQWSREEHAAAIERSDREHWVIEGDPDHTSLGYIIVYDLLREGLGVYVKRIVASVKSSGIGRSALRLLVDHAFRDLKAGSVALAVYPDNVRGQRSYRALGFVDVELPLSQRTALQSAVGGFPDNSLVMYVWPHTLRTPLRGVQG
jgi:ribosomal protein S18 acetylase RimI-like enzyme